MTDNRRQDNRCRALKGLYILAQGNALGSEKKGYISPERARYSEGTDGSTIYHALSGLDSFGISPQGVALGWYIPPRWGFSDNA